MPRPSKAKTRRHEVTDDVLKERLAAFEPEPLAPITLTEEAKLALSDIVVVESAPSASIVKVKGKDVVNFASADFMAFGSSPEVIKATEDALNRYGVGSCGPRGFYGTIDAHVKLEEALSQFFKKDEAIIYSDAASTVASAIPAFANRADLLLVDEGCNDNVFTGVKLSRAKLLLFKHNDMEDLERVMKQVQQEDERLNRKPASQRRFVIFEGLYRNSGDIAPLPRIYQLKMQYKWRLLADECLSFGVLGETGKGITELYADKIAEDCVEILIGSLETTLASVGGFCVGTHEVVEHQRLNGAGYCFSASAPPFTASAAQAALELLALSKTKLKSLREKSKLFSEAFLNDVTLQVLSDKESPVIHLRLNKTFDSALDEIKALRKITSQVLEAGYLVIPTYYPDSASPVKTRNTLRFYLHVDHTDKDLLACAEAVKKATKSVL